MYLALAFPGNVVPEELMRWSLAEKFGWTLEYIDGLSEQDLIEYMSIVDGRNNVNHSGDEPLA